MSTTIFDDVFRTIIVRLPRLAIPLINEVFGTKYSDEEEITQLRNEHFTKTEKVITDSILIIKDKAYHLECQSKDDAKMAIRMIEYDFAFALEHAKKKDGIIEVIFPNSCVIYLRGKGKKETNLKAKIVLPNGKKVDYTVPTIRAQDYGIGEIFQKRLIMLLPYYVMRYEEQADKIEEMPNLLDELLDEYRFICNRLCNEYSDSENEYTCAILIELINKISDYLFQDKDKIRKGMSEIMGGKILELEIDKKIIKSYGDGKKAGIDLGIRECIESLLKKNYSVNSIATMLSKPVSLVEQVQREMLQKA